MNQSYFTSPTLSKKLQQLGVESQFSAHYHKRKQERIVHFEEHNCQDEVSGPYFDKSQGDQKAYHWSDICMPDAAKKIWSYAEIPNALILVHKVRTGDWQSWLEVEIDKALGNKKGK